MLNPLAFALSPVALLAGARLLLYQALYGIFAFFLGLAMAVAPVGAWIAVTGRIDPPALWLGGAVVCWLFGFDILYALQDTEFDRANGLHSMPALLGNAGAMLVSRVSHAVMIGLLGHGRRVGASWHCLLRGGRAGRRRGCLGAVTGQSRTIYRGSIWHFSR